MKLYLSDFSALSDSKTKAQKEASRLLLEHILSRSFGLSLKEAGLARDSFGKPYFKNTPHIHFNLSHSGGLLFGGVDETPLGVDIEKPRPYNPSLARRFFAPGEAELLQSLPEKTREGAFFRLWTAKESYGKAVGRGLTLPLQEILVDGEKSAVRNADGAMPGLFFRHYEELPGFCLCVASPQNRFPSFAEIEWVTL